MCSSMPKPGTIIETLFLLATAALCSWLGVSVPVHFRAVSPAVLEEAGRNTESMADRAFIYLDNGQVGPLQVIWDASDRLPETESERIRAQTILQEHPVYHLSGGPAPYYEQYLNFIVETEELDRPGTVMEVLVLEPNRIELKEYLGASSKATVEQLIETRNAGGYRRFPPITSPAGHALDAAALATALLVQGGYFSLEMQRSLSDLARETIEGQQRSMDELENVYLGILSLGKRLDWNSLTLWVSSCPNIDVFTEMALQAQSRAEDIPVLFTALVMVDDPEMLARFLREQDDKGFSALLFALEEGAGSLDLLVEKNQPLYRAPAMVAWMDPMLDWAREGWLVGFTYRNPELALNTKIILFLIAGYTLSLAFARCMDIVGFCRNISRLHPLIILSNANVGVLFMAGMCADFETILDELDTETNAQLRLEFGLTSPLESLQSRKITPSMFDQITVITLSIFFFMQLMVYVFGLIRIADVRKQSIPAGTKLTLLSNEENLFDLGLYVGLGGTVMSLILLAMDIVQASLIAAYASTLFGIIFVAILKIFHLRPYRRRLILEVDGLR